MWCGVPLIGGRTRCFSGHHHQNNNHHHLTHFIARHQSRKYDWDVFGAQIRVATSVDLVAVALVYETG